MTGGSGGIGAAVCEAMIRNGSDVIDISIDEPATGPIDGHSYIRADLTSLRDRQLAYSQVATRWTHVDHIIHCIGINEWLPFEDWEEVRARHLFETNVWAPIAMTVLFLELLKHSTVASITFVSSTAASRGIAGTGPYAMSKASLESCVRTMAVEWAKIPIRVNAVSPTIIPTKMNASVRQTQGYLVEKLKTIPLGRMVTTIEAANAIAFLASPSAAGVTGTILPVDGGVMAKG